MLPTILSIPEIGILGVAFTIICVSRSSSKGFNEGTQVVNKINKTKKDTTNNICNNDRPIFGQPTINDPVQRMFKAIRHSESARTYSNPFGKTFDGKEDVP